MVSAADQRCYRAILNGGALWRSSHRYDDPPRRPGVQGTFRQHGQHGGDALILKRYGDSLAMWVGARRWGVGLRASEGRGWEDRHNGGKTGVAMLSEGDASSCGYLFAPAAARKRSRRSRKAGPAELGSSHRSIWMSSTLDERISWGRSSWRRSASRSSRGREIRRPRLTVGSSGDSRGRVSGWRRAAGGGTEVAAERAGMPSVTAWRLMVGLTATGGPLPRAVLPLSLFWGPGGSAARCGRGGSGGRGRRSKRRLISSSPFDTGL